MEVPVISREAYLNAEAVYPEILKSVAVMYKGDWVDYANQSGGCVHLALGSMTSLR